MIGPYKKDSNNVSCLPPLPYAPEIPLKRIQATNPNTDQTIKNATMSSIVTTIAKVVILFYVFLMDVNCDHAH